MRATALVLSVLVLASSVSATPRARAVVRGPVVWIDGAPAWRGSVSSPLVWSDDSAAVAFIGRDGHGRAALVVIVPGGDTPAIMTWPIPFGAQARAVTWLGPTRIGAGPSELDPRLVASFSVER